MRKNSSSAILAKVAAFVLFLLCTCGALPGQGADNPTPKNAAEGRKFYQMANDRLKTGKSREELNFLFEAFARYETAAENGDSDGLIMSFLLFNRIKRHKLAETAGFSLRLPETFRHNVALIHFIKKELRQDFPFINQMDIFHGVWAARYDKIRLLEDCKSIAADLRRQAREMTEKARSLREHADIAAAIDLLKQSLLIWDLEEAPRLLSEYEKLLIVQKASQQEIEQAVANKNFPEADAALKESFLNKLTYGDFYALSANNLKNDWSDTLLRDAEFHYRKKKLDLALEYCEQSLEIRYSERAEDLRSQIRKRQKSLSVFLALTVPGPFSGSHNDYTWNGNSSVFGESEDQNVVRADAFSAKPSWGLGATYMISGAHGIRLSLSRGGQEWKYFTSYVFRWKWLGGENPGETATSRATMSENARLTLTLLDVNYVFKAHVVKDLYLRFNGGPVIYFTAADYYSRMGYGGLWALPQGGAVEEWFPFHYRISDSGAGLGFNIGAGLEWQIPPFGLFLDGQYYFLYVQKLDWVLLSKAYNGGFNNLVVGDPKKLDHLPLYRLNVDYSQPRFTVGIRYYLF